MPQSEFAEALVQKDRVPNNPVQDDLRQLLEVLYTERSLQPFFAGQWIPLKEKELWVVYRGVVLLSTLYPSGDEALLGLASPSMPFGLPLVAVNPYQAIALSDVDLLPLRLNEIEQSPRLAQGLWGSLSRRLRQTEALLALAGNRRVEDRLRQLLLVLAQEVGQPVGQSQDGATRLGIRLTHQHLANAIGATRVTVTRLLGQFKRRGWLTIDKQRHLIIHATAADYAPDRTLL